MARVNSPQNLVLIRTTLELRYPTAYLLWDKTGQMWTELSAKKFDIERISALPNESHFKAGKDVEVKIGLEMMSFVSLKLEGVKIQDFLDVCEEIYRVATQVLDIVEFTRIGFRTHHVDPYDDLGPQALEKLKKLPFAKFPDPEPFGSEIPIVAAEYVYRFGNDNVGYRVQLELGGMEMGVEDLPLLRIESKTFKVVGLLYDVDAYTKKTVLRSQLRLKPWVHQHLSLTIKAAKQLIYEQS